jgi:hypothetical protein
MIAMEMLSQIRLKTAGRVILAESSIRTVARIPSNWQWLEGPKSQFSGGPNENILKYIQEYKLAIRDYELCSAARAN